MNEPFVSVIVAAYNSEKKISKCINSLFNIGYPNYEIIVIDDGSTDRTKDVLSEFKGRINIIESKHSGPSKCRNIAVKEAKGEFIAFTDSDCIVDRNWIKELVKCFINDKVAGSGGIQLSPEDETHFGKRVQKFFDLTGFLGGYIKSSRSEELKEVSHNPSCNVMYRKSAFLEIGGFDEDIWPSEDVDLDFRLKKRGFIFMFNPKAIIYHYRAQSIKQLASMMHRYGVMQGILTKKYGFFRRIQFIPVILIVLLIMIIANYFWLIIPLVLYFYMLIKLKSLSKASSVVFLSLVSAFFWNVGFLKGLLTFRR